MGEEADVNAMIDQFLAFYEANRSELDMQTAIYEQPAAEESLSSECTEWWTALSVSAQRKWLINPATSTMYAAWRESCKRLDAVRFGRASLRLSGFQISPESEAQAMRYVNGEIELADFIGCIDQQA